MSTTMEKPAAESAQLSLSLTEREADRLRRCEAAVEQGLKTFLQVASALEEIRAGRLYRLTHPSFEAYCRERWGWSRQHAARLIGTLPVVAELEAAGLPALGGALPANETQVRPLTGVTPGHRAEVLLGARDRADAEGVPLTGAIVQASADAFMGRRGGGPSPIGDSPETDEKAQSHETVPLGGSDVQTADDEAAEMDGAASESFGAARAAPDVAGGDLRQPDVAPALSVAETPASGVDVAPARVIASPSAPEVPPAPVPADPFRVDPSRLPALHRRIRTLLAETIRRQAPLFAVEACCNGTPAAAEFGPGYREESRRYAVIVADEMERAGARGVTAFTPGQVVEVERPGAWMPAIIIDAQIINGKEVVSVAVPGEVGFSPQRVDQVRPVAVPEDVTGPEDPGPLGHPEAIDGVPAQDWALLAALRVGEPSHREWDRMRETGATDEKIRYVLGIIWAGGPGGASPNRPPWQTEGGASPRLWVDSRKGLRPTLTGRELIAETRRVLGIPPVAPPPPTPEAFFPTPEAFPAGSRVAVDIGGGQTLRGEAVSVIGEAAAPRLVEVMLDGNSGRTLHGAESVRPEAPPESLVPEPFVLGVDDDPLTVCPATGKDCGHTCHAEDPCALQDTSRPLTPAPVDDPRIDTARNCREGAFQYRDRVRFRATEDYPAGVGVVTNVTPEGKVWVRTEGGLPPRRFEPDQVSLVAAEPEPSPGPPPPSPGPLSAEGDPSPAVPAALKKSAARKTAAVAEADPYAPEPDLCRLCRKQPANFFGTCDACDKSFEGEAHGPREADGQYGEVAA